jgi:hypothetical protein
VCLCKLHHWAFDEGLIEISFNGRHYVVRIPHEPEDDMLDKPEFSIDFLRSVAGTLLDSRLPQDTAMWPSPELLERLRSILA